MLDQNIIEEINNIRSGPCHFGVAEDNLMGDQCDNVGDNDTWATDISLVTCHHCKLMASQVLRWAMRHPERLPKYAKTGRASYKVAF